MNKWTKTARWICIVCVLGTAGNLFAQTDHFIENQRYVVGLNDFSWGDTYVGKTTSGNGLLLEEQINGTETNTVKLTINSLQIGSETNSGNTVEIYKGGELRIAGDFTVLGTNNGNGLLIGDQGTLFMQSDFDASMGGFYYNSGANLMVGGEVSNLDNVEGGLNFTLTGDGATWSFGTNLLTIGEISDANSVSISNSALLEIDNISIGSATNVNNGFVVSDNGRVFVQDSIDILGSNNYLRVTNSGILAVDFDFDASVGIVEIQEGGILEAHQDLIYHGITNGGGIIMTGTNANWSNLSGSTLLVGPSTDENTLTITDGAIVRAGGIAVGSVTNKDNKIFINNGGNLILGSIASTLSDTNEIWVTEGGKITFESDYNLSTDGSFFWGNGGILEAQGEAPIFGTWRINNEYDEHGTLFLNNGKTLILNGSSARWSAFGDNLHIGDLSPDNHLIITNGGQAFVNSTSIGDFKYGNFSDGGNNNSILITGTNSLLDSSSYVAIGGTIDSGIWYEGGISNSITVNNGGLLSVGTMLHNRNTTGTSGLNIGPGGIVEAQDYYQASGASLNIYTDASGINAGLLSVTNNAEFEAGARVGFDAVAALDIARVYTNQIVESGTLIVGGITNATTADLDVLENTGGSLVNYDLWETNQNIYATFTRRSITDGGGLDPDSMLDLIAQEIDRLASEGNAAASNQVEILSAMGSDLERKLQLEQMYSYQIPTYMHNQGVFGGIDQVRARGLSAHEPASSKPKGAAGPHAEEQGLQGWAKVYGSFGNRDADDESGFVDGYDAQTYGTVFGLDQAFGDWLFGLAGGFAGSILDGDNGDESDATTGYGILYANYGTKEWFGDLVLSYGLTDMDNTSGTDFDVTSSTEASQTMFYIGGGYQLEDKPSGALFRPLFGLQVSQFDQDAYTEKSPNALAKDVEAYDRLSAQSTLGASLIFPKTGSKVDMELQLRTYWLHEFNNDEENVGYTLIDSGLPGQFILRSPDQDIAQLGMGFVTKGKNGWQLRADIDLQLSETFTSTTLSGALLYEF